MKLTVYRKFAAAMLAGVGVLPTGLVVQVAAVLQFHLFSTDIRTYTMSTFNFMLRHSN
jgi:hypothetical protein